MKRRGYLLCILLAFAASSRGADLERWIDNFDQSLALQTSDEQLRARLSGMVDFEFFFFSGEAPGLIDTRSSTLFNPRLTLFLDAQYSSCAYFFAQARLDRGFDPSDNGAHLDLEEYALRLTPFRDLSCNLQIGKFATVAGTWVQRHLSWDNPFINAPVPYENTTPVSDTELPGREFFHPSAKNKYERLPIIWGPNYASGISVSAKISSFELAAEMKNASLSSRPEEWDVTSRGFGDPTVTARLAWKPSPTWTFGASASGGAYLRPAAIEQLPPGKSAGDFREVVIGEDVSFAWHHWQVWAECFESRFEIPFLGKVDAVSYYLELKYRFTPQLAAALRWNQQLFADLPNSGDFPSSQNLSRADAALTFRFTPHAQLKVQYTVSDSTQTDHTLGAQFTVRF